MKRPPEADKPKTADEESVAHSWKTSPVLVWVDVDAGIADVVCRLNKVRGIRTLASCEGHKLSEYERRAHVVVRWFDEAARERLWDLASIHPEWSLDFHEGRQAMLYIEESE